MHIGLGMSIVGGRYATAPSGITYLSDVGGTPTAAYSVRKVVSDYSGSAIRVRESSGDTETDIGFSGEGLDEAALLAHCGANDGFVTKWYDQSGSGYDAVQAAGTAQPKIVSAGTVIKENGMPALDFDGVNDQLVNGGISAMNYLSLHAVYNAPNTAETVLSIIRSSNTKSDFLFRSNAFFIRFFDSDSDVDFIDVTLNSNQKLTSVFWDGVVPANSSTLPPDGTISSYVDGSLFDDSALDTNYVLTGSGLYIGNDPANTFLDGTIQELIVYNSDKSSLRTAIEGNINGYYSIYP